MALSIDSLPPPAAKKMRRWGRTTFSAQISLRRRRYGLQTNRTNKTRPQFFHRCQSEQALPAGVYSQRPIADGRHV